MFEIIKNDITLSSTLVTKSNLINKLIKKNIIILNSKILPLRKEKFQIKLSRKLLSIYFITKYP